MINDYFNKRLSHPNLTITCIDNKYEYLRNEMTQFKETLQRMKTLDIHLPEVHAFTAHAGNDDRTKYRQLGFDGVLTKPITPSELEEFLKTHVHARHNRN